MINQYMLDPVTELDYDIYDLLSEHDYDLLFFGEDVEYRDEFIEGLTLAFSPTGGSTGVKLECNGTVVGFAIVTGVEHELYVAIHPDHTGKGYGKIMTNLVVEKCLSSNVLVVTAVTHSSNVHMCNILKRIGTEHTCELGVVQYKLDTTYGFNKAPYVPLLNSMRTPN